MIFTRPALGVRLAFFHFGYLNEPLIVTGRVEAETVGYPHDKAPQSEGPDHRQELLAARSNDLKSEQTVNFEQTVNLPDPFYIIFLS